MTTKAETKEILAERREWHALGKPMGWTLYGWTFRDQATYYTDDPYKAARPGMIEVTWKQMQDIAGAIKAAKREKGNG